MKNIMFRRRSLNVVTINTRLKKYALSAQRLLNHHRQSCILIQTGKSKSRRHDMFRNSLKSRQNLDAQSFSFRKFSEEQHEFVMRWLKREFWNGKQQKALDYVLRVLQQEMFIHIFMDFYGFHGSNYSQAEVKMARWE